ncbi:MAG: amino acid--tRNA ligase-related protein, partial [bacterium]
MTPINKKTGKCIGALPGSGPLCQLGHVFRGGEQGPLHRPEFTLLEWYRPGTDYRGMMDDTVELLRFLVHTLADLPPVVERDGRRVDLTAEAERLTVYEAFCRHAGGPPPDPSTPEGEERFFRILVEQIEPHLGVGTPTFLIDYPEQQASLAKIRPGPPAVAERAELYLAGVEICNAFSELTDPVEQC